MAFWQPSFHREHFWWGFRETVDGSTEAWSIHGARTSTKTSSQLCSMVERVHFVAAGLEHLRSPSETIQNFARKCYRRLSEQQSINWSYNRMVKEGKTTWSWFKFCGMTWWGFFSQKHWSETGVGGVLLNSFASLYTSYSYRHIIFSQPTQWLPSSFRCKPPTVRLCLQLWLRWRLDTFYEHWMQKFC